MNTVDRLTIFAVAIAMFYGVSTSTAERQVATSTHKEHVMVETGIFLDGRKLNITESEELQPAIGIRGDSTI